MRARAVRLEACYTQKCKQEERLPYARLQTPGNFYGRAINSALCWGYFQGWLLQAPPGPSRRGAQQAKGNHGCVTCRQNEGFFLQDHSVLHNPPPRLFPPSFKAAWVDNKRVSKNAWRTSTHTITRITLKITCLQSTSPGI